MTQIGHRFFECPRAGGVRRKPKYSLRRPAQKRKPAGSPAGFSYEKDLSYAATLLVYK
jgi:hypothetical protein